MNCKQGDLAIIVHQSDAAPNLGRIVEVMEWRGEYGLGKWPCWLVKAPRPMNVFDPLTRLPSQSVLGVIPDAWLRPVSGIPTADEILDEVTA
ncbi:hypothetical protein [Burkholderia ubonensis]|uniref:hypothetical protein n=1 Tax=Burkholderia ubonensis TaxID=101571 RepID=UPI000757716D|nr:hypothetical protein [Burkholderia ubonensis]KVO11742.1 hypothetical protein WJ73_19535 [Burkholderia ubonensis]